MVQYTANIHHRNSNNNGHLIFLVNDIKPMAIGSIFLFIYWLDIYKISKTNHADALKIHFVSSPTDRIEWLKIKLTESLPSKILECGIAPCDTT